MYRLGRYTFYFVIYSLLGAVGETLFRLVTEQQFYGVHGFLHLPLLPIYGFGALSIILIARKVRSPVVLFFVGAAVATVLEFAASWLIEVIFDIRIWDYSAKVFNLQGRVSLETSLIFGLGGLLAVYGIHPFVSKYIKQIPKKLITIGMGVVWAILLTDATLSVLGRL